MTKNVPPSPKTRSDDPTAPRLSRQLPCPRPSKTRSKLFRLRERSSGLEYHPALHPQKGASNPSWPISNEHPAYEKVGCFYVYHGGLTHGRYANQNCIRLGLVECAQ